MKNKILKNIEWGILFATLILVIIGLIALFSSTQNSDYEEFKKQIIWIAVAIPVMLIFTFVDYTLIARASPFFYGIFIILLIAVLFTTTINGASSWFDIGPFSFQPAEFSKVFVIIFIASMLVKIQSKGKNQINRPTRLLIILAIVAVPVLLIIKQPDYGTAIAYLLALVLMLFAAGIDKKYIIASILIVAIVLPLSYFFILPEHAKTRIDVFLNPNLDPRGARI